MAILTGTNQPVDIGAFTGFCKKMYVLVKYGELLNT